MCEHNLEFQYINPTTQVALYSYAVDKSTHQNSIEWKIYQGLMNSSTDIQKWDLFPLMKQYRNQWFFGKYTRPDNCI